MTDLADLNGYLSPSLGEQKAHAVLEDACGTLAINAMSISFDEALAILEHIATTNTGLVSITARFAKSRIHLTLIRA